MKYEKFYDSVLLMEDNKSLEFNYNDGELFINFKNNIDTDDNFIIDKSNYEVYEAFDYLFYKYSIYKNDDINHIIYLSSSSNTRLKIIHLKDYFRLIFTPRDINKTNISVLVKTNNLIQYPLNELFIELYNNLKLLDDVKSYGHQIHLEEYVLSKKNNVT